MISLDPEGWYADDADVVSLIGVPIDLRIGDLLLDDSFEVVGRPFIKDKRRNIVGFEIKDLLSGAGMIDQATCPAETKVRITRRRSLLEEWPDDPRNAVGYCPVGYRMIRRQTSDIPRGSYLFFDEEMCLVDSAYADGVVLFMDGSSYQSHPQAWWDCLLEE